MSNEDFNILDDAKPVTSDAEDSVRSAVDQPEADLERRHHASDQIVENGDGVSETILSSKPRYLAACRWCGVMFQTLRASDAHSCSKRPVASCRFCGEIHTSRQAADEHLYSCEQFRQHNERQLRNRDLETRGGVPELRTGPYIDPWYHEFQAYVKYDVGLRSYFGLNSLQKEHDFEEHGALRTSIEDDRGDSWGVEFSFKTSGLAPRNDPNFRLETVREYLVKVFPDAYDSHADAKSEARKAITFTVRPRWPDLESLGDSPNPSNPHDIEGFDIEFNGSNIEFTRYPELLEVAMTALRDRQGFRFSNPTRIRAADFAPEQIHHSSNIVDAELYVRVCRDLTGKVYAFDGTLHRTSMLLGDERRGYAKTVRDDRKCEGHYHAATIDDERAGELIGRHNLAKEIKHYHMRDPDANEGTNLENPKIGVAFQHSISDQSPKWDELERLERELDEALLNVLSWSDIPVRPESGVFVEDDHFKVTGSSRFRKLIAAQLPRIKAQQDRQLQAVVSNVTETDAMMLETLLTDGGQWSPAELADRIGRHVDTVYKAIQRLGGLVEHSYGDVQLGSSYLAQEVVSRIEGMKDAVRSDLSQAADDLVRARLFGEGDTPWSRWLDHYVERIDESDDGPDQLVLGYRPETKRDAKRLLREGAGSWAQVTGEEILDFAKAFVPVVETAEGITYQPSRIDFQRLLPGYSVRYGTIR